MEVIGFILAIWLIGHFLVAILDTSVRTPKPDVTYKPPPRTKRYYTRKTATPEPIEEPTTVPYVTPLHLQSADGLYTTMEQYIKYSTIWFAKRMVRLKQDNYICQSCGATDNLQIHHITYKNLYNENIDKELVTVCGKCHKAIHDRCGKDAGWYPLNSGKD